MPLCLIPRLFDADLFFGVVWSSKWETLPGTLHAAIVHWRYCCGNALNRQRVNCLMYLSHSNNPKTIVQIPISLYFVLDPKTSVIPRVITPNVRRLKSKTPIKRLRGEMTPETE
jgi:hypothetical protein